MYTGPVESYELSIRTGNSGTFEDYGEARADIILLGKKGRRLATITFHPPHTEVPGDAWYGTDEPELHLPTDMLSSVLAFLESEKPVTLTYGEGSTRNPWGILTTTSG
jgi:hypothetical protein